MATILEVGRVFETTTVVGLLRSLEIAPSCGQARRWVAQGAVFFNGVRFDGDGDDLLTLHGPIRIAVAGRFHANVLVAGPTAVHVLAER